MNYSYWTYHEKQYDQMYRSTSAIIDFLKPRLPCGEKKSVLDIGCGGGANTYWLKKSFPQYSFLGIDIDTEAIALAKKMNKDDPDLKFEVQDFMDVQKPFPAGFVDYIFAIQLVSFVDFDLSIFLKKAFATARKGIFLTSLFSEGWIEQHTIAYDLEESWKGIYKVHSLEKLKHIIHEIAGDKATLEVDKFEIDIDLPKPSKPKFGTYTIKTENGRKMQVSGYMLMPWYNLLIKMKGDTR